MAPVLNATAIQDESELNEEAAAEETTASELKIHAGEPGPVRTIELLEADAGSDWYTGVILLVQQGSDGRYRSGFSITRQYVTSPHEQDGQDLPPIDPTVDEGFELLGEAVAAATDMADEWLCFHSEEDDGNAKGTIEWLQSWIGELDPASVTESIFDELPEPATEPPADLAPEAEPVPVYEDRCPCEAGKQLPPRVTAEAQKHFNERKHALEERIGKLSIEQVRLKAAVKCNRECMNSVTEELQSHIARGPEALPLFDKAKPAKTSLISQREIPLADEEAEAPDGETVEVEAVQKHGTINLTVGDIVTDNSWRDVSVEELGIDPKLCIILREAQDTPITTLGDIADFCEKYQLVDLHKIGKAKAEKIEEAMDAYWTAHPRT